MAEVLKTPPIPWQKRKEIGFFQALKETVTLVLFKPKEFFSRWELSDSLLEPFYFYFMINWTAIALSFLVEMLLLEKIKLWLVYFLVVVFMLPLSLVFSILFFSSLMHLLVFLCGGRGGFKVTFNILAYSTAVNIFTPLPVIGIFISAIWGVIVCATGLRRLYNFNLTKTVITVVLPFLVVTLIYFLSAALLLDFSQTKIALNNSACEESLKTMATAIENYSRDHQGNYPKDEYDLRFTQPPYLERTYNKEAIDGYIYFMNFTKEGYELGAVPLACGLTGSKLFKVKTGGILEKGNCTQ